MFEKVNPSHPDKVADRIAGAIVDLCYTKSRNRWSNESSAESHSSIAESRQSSPIGNGIPYKDIVEQARLYIHTIGGFEKFAEWGLVRPLAQV